MEFLVRNWIDLVQTEDEHSVWGLFELALYDVSEIPVLDDHEKPSYKPSYIVMRRIVSLLAMLEPYWLDKLHHKMCKPFLEFEKEYPDRIGLYMTEDILLHGKQYLESFSKDRIDYHKNRNPKFGFIGLMVAMHMNLPRAKNLIRSFVQNPIQDVILDVIPLEETRYYKE